jgi:hypothetical protein
LYLCFRRRYSAAEIEAGDILFLISDVCEYLVRELIEHDVSMFILAELLGAGSAALLASWL